jgi:hypothetical protein
MSESRLLRGPNDTSGEGDCKGIQCGLPSVHPALAASAGGVEAHEGEVDALERGGLGREMPAGVHSSADPGVDALDRVCRVDHGPDLGVEAEEGDELGPCVLPQLDDGGVAGFPHAGEVGEAFQRGGLGGGGVDRFEVFGDGGPVPPRRVTEGVLCLPALSVGPRFGGVRVRARR